MSFQNSGPQNPHGADSQRRLEQKFRQQTIFTTVTVSNHTRDPTLQSTQYDTAVHGAHPFAPPVRSMTAPSSRPPAYTPVFTAPEDDWQSMFGHLKPGMADVRLEGNKIKSGGKVNITGKGTGVSTLYAAKNTIDSPKITCSLQGSAVGIRFGRSGDRGNQVDSPNFTIEYQHGQEEKVSTDGHAFAAEQDLDASQDEIVPGNITAEQ